jgi:hypothetical protein
MIKKLISKLFGIKECACPEDMNNPIILENEIVVEEKWKCGTHNRYKKSCSICRQLAGVA